MFKKKNQKLGKLIKKEYSRGNDFINIMEKNGEFVYSNPVEKNDEIPVEMLKRRVAKVREIPMTFAVASHVMITLEEET